MASVIEESYTPAIQVHKATPLFNVKDWLIPHLSGRFQNHTKPLWFQFLRSRDGTTRMHYKLWVNDSWLPEETDGESGLICLQVKATQIQLQILFTWQYMAKDLTSDSHREHLYFHRHIVSDSTAIHVGLYKLGPIFLSTNNMVTC